MATIRKRNDKWHVQVRRKGQPSLTKSFQKKADAQAWARHMEAEADRQALPIDPKALQRIVFKDLIERYRDEVVSAKKCRVSETASLNVILRHSVACSSLAELSSAKFSAYRDERLKAVKPGTVRRDLGILHHLFEIARTEWGIPILMNPLADVKKPVSDKARNRRLEGQPELDRLLSAASKSRNKFIEPLIRFAIETGMRRGEIIGIRWHHIDLTKRTLHIPQTKNGHPRTIPLSLGAIEVLQQVRGSDDERVFPLTTNAVRLSWQRIVKRAGLQNLHLHDLRHEAITRFFEKGLSVPEVALISGHKDLRMLHRYTHLRAEDIARKLA